MRARTVSLYTRERSTRRIRAYNRRKDYPTDTIWVLRYDGRWETLAAGITHKEAEMWRSNRQGQLLQGIVMVKPAAVVGPHKEEALTLDKTIDTYLKEIQQTKSRKTYQAYGTALKYFLQAIGDKPLASIGRTDLIRYKTFLRDDAELATRSVTNSYLNVMTFLKFHNAKPADMKRKDTPSYTEKEPEIYEQDAMDKFFDACNEEEHLLFTFFKQTACREQEVINATDEGLRFGTAEITVRSIEEGDEWNPKAYRERTIPVSRDLMNRLKAMLVARGRGGLLFPTSTGGRKLDMLDVCKAIAKRAGMDESDFWLHKWRSTTITAWLRQVRDHRTVMQWSGHRDMASLLRYWKPQANEAVRAEIDQMWAR